MSVLTDDKRFIDYIADNSDRLEGTTMCEVLDRAEARGEAKTIEKMVVGLLKSNVDVNIIAKAAGITLAKVMEIGKKASVM